MDASAGTLSRHTQPSQFSRFLSGLLSCFEIRPSDDTFQRHPGVMSSSGGGSAAWVRNGSATEKRRNSDAARADEQTKAVAAQQQQQQQHQSPPHPSMRVIAVAPLRSSESESADAHAASGVPSPRVIATYAHGQLAQPDAEVAPSSSRIHAALMRGGLGPGSDPVAPLAIVPQLVHLSPEARARQLIALALREAAAGSKPLAHVSVTGWFHSGGGPATRVILYEASALPFPLRAASRASHAGRSHGESSAPNCTISIRCLSLCCLMSVRACAECR